MITERESKLMADELEEAGYKNWATYVRLFGGNEPLTQLGAFDGDMEKAEALAKKCVDAKKTATELGLYKPLETGAII